MKTFTLLAITLCIASLTYARPNAHTNVVFGNGFGGATFSDFEYSVPVVGSESWAGFGNSDDSIYPIVMESGATITFDAYSVSNTPANCRVRFEYNPHPDVDPSYDTPSVTISNDVLTTYSINVPSQGANTFSSFLFYNETFGQTIYMTNFTITGLDDGDTTPPSPNPMTFELEPTTVSDQALGMRATVGVDDNPVWYYFSCTTDPSLDSGWQLSPEYIVDGLSLGTTHTFTVQARDDSYLENIGAVSGSFSATTLASYDTTAPSPNPPGLSIDPSASTLRIVADEVSDASWVEYNFVNTAGNGPNSGWQRSNVYVASGLAPETSYSYTVQARDISLATNMTAISTGFSAVTDQTRVRSFGHALTDLNGVSSDGDVVHQLANEKNFELLSRSEEKEIIFDTNGATFDAALRGDTGRNYIRTIADTHHEYDFTFEATVTITSDDQQAFFGVGSGAEGTYGLPDVDVPGGAYIMQLQAVSNSTYRVDQYGATAWNTEAPEEGSYGAGTYRLRLVNDATNGLFSFAIDESYVGGDFVVDAFERSINHIDVWNPDALPSRNTDYALDQVVYVPEGQAPTTNWEESTGVSTSTDWDYPSSGGAGDNGAYLRMTSVDTPWAVSVVSTNNAPVNGIDVSLDGKYLPLADYGLAGDQLITFQMDIKAFSSDNGTAGIKFEFCNAAKDILNEATREFTDAVESEWTTKRWNVGTPTEAVYVVVVPVQFGTIDTGYDNLGFVPNPSVDVPEASSRLIIGGDEGVVFKDLTLVADTGAVVVDPYSIGSISAIEEGFVITWSGQSGVSYDVEYKTSLIGGTWTKTLNSILTEGDGTVSATSSVQEAAAFFRVVGE